MGSGVRGLASPHPFLGATTSLSPCSRSSCSPSCSCSGGASDSVHDQSAGHSSCMQLATWWCCTPCALCLVRQWIHVLRRLRGAFGRFFYGLWYSAPEVDSVLLSFVAAHVVDNGSGMCFLVPGFSARRPVFPSIAAGLGMETSHS